jgi:hypothetical protein
MKNLEYEGLCNIIFKPSKNNITTYKTISYFIEKRLVQVRI